MTRAIPSGMAAKKKITAKQRAVTTYDLAPEERKALAARAVRDRRSVSFVVAEAVREYLRRGGT